MTGKKLENLDVQTMTDRVLVTLDELGNIELSGIKLNKPDKALLDVGELDINQHVSMQPSAVAYYGSVKKEAIRELFALKRAYDRWKCRKWAEAKVKASASADGYKPTQTDIEARLIVDNTKELEEWDAKLDQAQENADTMESWFEAWRQKSFAIKEHVSIDMEGMWTGDSIPGDGRGAKDGEKVQNDMNSEKIRKVKDIMRKRREQGNLAQ